LKIDGKPGTVAIKVFAWNVLNKKCLKHMQKVDKNDNQRLGNHPIANMDPAAQAAREWNVCTHIKSETGSSPFTIICLQEVSGSLLEMLKRTFDKTHFIEVTRIS